MGIAAGLLFAAGLRRHGFSGLFEKGA